MDFNAILRPFSKFKDAVLCMNLTSIFPKIMPDRITNITAVLQNFAPGYSKQQIEAVVDKYESILPRFDDNIGNIKNSLPSQDVVAFINKQDNMMIRNLFPPMSSCCGKQLRMEKPNKVVIFEKLACWKGYAFTAKCNVCHVIFDISHYTDAEKMRYYYKDADTMEYFRSTRETVFHRSFLMEVDRDL